MHGYRTVRIGVPWPLMPDQIGTYVLFHLPSFAGAGWRLAACVQRLSVGQVYRDCRQLYVTKLHALSQTRREENVGVRLNFVT